VGRHAAARAARRGDAVRRVHAALWQLPGAVAGCRQCVPARPLCTLGSYRAHSQGVGSACPLALSALGALCDVSAPPRGTLLSTPARLRPRSLGGGADCLPAFVRTVEAHALFQCQQVASTVPQLLLAQAWPLHEELMLLGACCVASTSALFTKIDMHASWVYDFPALAPRKRQVHCSAGVKIQY